MILKTDTRRLRGFTLVELVMVIALASVVAVMVSSLLSRPLEGFMAQSRRAELTDMAAIALNRMTRDIRLAVPNSLRVSDSDGDGYGDTLELLPIHEAGRYRANQLPNASGNIDLNSVRYDPPRCPPPPGTCQIEVLSPLDKPRVEESKWMVIYNIGAGSASAPQAGANVWAYGKPGVITPTGVGFGLEPAQPPENKQKLVLSGVQLDGFGFAYASPQHRFYLAKEVVGYKCVTEDGETSLRRASFSDLRAAGTYEYGNARWLVGSVSRCRINYKPGTNTRNALVTIELGVKKGGEEVVLLQQVHVDNAP